MMADSGDDDDDDIFDPADDELFRSVSLDGEDEDESEEREADSSSGVYTGDAMIEVDELDFSREESDLDQQLADKIREVSSDSVNHFQSKIFDCSRAYS
jgi:hypothetical protein